MTTRSVIEVDVQDEKFVQFKALYDEYKAALDEAPASWLAASQGINEAEESTKNLSKEEKALANQRKKHDIDETKRNNTRKKEEEAAAKRWKALGGIMAGTLSNIVKIGSFSTAIAAGGGIIGLNKLSNDASELRFKSMGTGIDPGALSSARVNYQSAIGSSDATLAAIRDVKSDATKQGSFVGLGIKDFEGKTADKILPELLKATQQLVKNSPPGQELNIAHAYGADNFFSPEELIRFKNMSVQEMDNMIARAAQDRKELNTRDSALLSFQDLKKQWDRFSTSIEKTLIEGLEPLAPGLEKFSNSISKAFKILMGADEIKPALDQMGDGLEKMAAYLVSPEFKKDFNDFREELKDGASAIVEFLHSVREVTDFLHLTTPKNTGAGEQEKSLIKSDYKDDLGRGIAKTLAFFGNKDAKQALEGEEKYRRSSKSKQESWEKARPFLEKAGRAAGIDPGILAKIANTESGFNPEADNPNSTAFGYGQFINSTWREMIEKHADKYGLDKKNPERYRHDEGVQASMLAEFAKENMEKGRALGGNDDAANVYALHNLGGGGGNTFLKALKEKPDAKVSEVLGGKVISGNPGLYGNGNITIAEAYKNIGDKMRSGDSYAQNIRGLDNAKPVITDSYAKPVTSAASSMPSAQKVANNNAQQHPGMKIVIENNTGGQVNVSAAAL